MRYFYKINENTIIDEGGNEHNVYGIGIYENGGYFPSRVIHDIFGDRGAAEWFVALCNSLGLCPEQLDDAVEDVICA